MHWLLSRFSTLTVFKFNMGTSLIFIWFSLFKMTAYFGKIIVDEVFYCFYFCSPVILRRASLTLLTFLGYYSITAWLSVIFEVPHVVFVSEIRILRLSARSFKVADKDSFKKWSSSEKRRTVCAYFRLGCDSNYVEPASPFSMLVDGNRV